MKLNQNLICVICLVTAAGAFQSCSPDAGSISKALLASERMGASHGGGGPVINLDNDLTHSNQQLTVKFVDKSDYQNELSSLSDSSLYIELSKNSDYSDELQTFKRNGSADVSLDDSLDAVPVQAWILTDDSQSQSWNPRKCTIEVKPASSSSWQISVAATQSCQDSDRATLLKQIERMTIVFQDKDPNVIQN